MSNILKGILNESNPFYGHNDPAKEYGAEDPSYPKRGRHSQTDDDEYDPYGLIRQEKDFAKGRAMKAAKEKAQRDSDHDRLASGTNEGAPIATTPGSIEPGGAVDNFKQQMANKTEINYKKKQQGVAEAIRPVPVDDKGNRIPDRLSATEPRRPFGQPGDSKSSPKGVITYTPTGIVHKSHHGDITPRPKAVPESDDPWGDQGNFAGDKPVTVGGVSMKNSQVGDTVKYLGQSAKIVGMSKDRKHSRITISKGMGTVTQDVLTSDLQQLGRGTEIKEDDKNRMRMDQYYDLADAIQEKIRNAIKFGDKELIQKLNKERDELDARVKQHGLMPESQLDELSTDYLTQYKTAAGKDASKADSEGNYNRGNKRMRGITNATKKQFANDKKKSSISQGISEESNRFNSKQEVINHFVKNGKSAAAGAAAWERGYRGSSNKPIELKKPPQRSYHDDLDDKRYASIDENLGDQLKSTSLDALVKAKLEIEKQRQAEIDAWSQDFQKNTVQKAQQGLRRELQPTPVAQPGEKHSVLKARLAQLNNAIQKQELLDKLVDRLERRGILTPAMQNDADTTMHVRYGSKDNYESLNKKLDNAIQTLQSRLNIRKISGLKEVHDERDEYDNPRQGRDYGKGNLFVDPGSNEFEKNVPVGVPGGPRGAPKHLKGISKALPADAFGRTTGKIPRGKPGTVHSKMSNTDEVDEGWSQKYKSSINCSHPKGFSQKAHCAGKKKNNESIEMEMTCEDCGMCQTHGDHTKDKLDELKCWSGYHRVAGTKAGFPGSCAKNKTNEEQHSESCPHCGGEMVSEDLMNEKKDACYYKVKSRYKVWPSAYASGALVKCRNKGASNWGNGGKKNESSILEGINRADESLHDWFNKEKWVRMDTKGNIKGPCAKEPGEGKPKCLPQSKAHSLGKKGRASAAQRKRREDPNPERSGKAINVNTKKQSNENIDEDWKKKLGAAALAGSMALGAAGAHARVTPDGQGGFTGGLKPTATVTAPTDNKPAAEAPKGFSQEYLQKAADPNRFGRYLISVEKAQELLKQGQGQ